MKSLFYLLVFLLVAGLICTKTKPEKSSHVRSVAVAIVDEIEAGNLLPGIKDTKFADKATDVAFVREVVDKMLTIDNYGVFTLGKIRWMDKEYVVSLGIMGKVFTFSDAKAAKDFLSSLEEKVTDKLKE